MREYSLPIDKAFSQGLRIDRHSLRGEDFLSKCTGCKTSAFGLVPEREIVNPCTDVSELTQYTTFPFRQLIRGKSITFLADSTELWQADESVYPWSLSAISIYDAYSPQIAGTISAGGVWHFVDFYDVWLLFNGVTSVFKTNIAGMFGNENNVFATDEVTIATGCEFRGRAIFGGFNPDNYVTPDWESFWRSWVEENEVRFPNETQLGKNFVSWTTIGGGDLLNVFYPRNAVFGNVPGDTSRSVSDSILFDLYRRNELGFMPMPSRGPVLCVKPLGDGIMVYSADSIVYMFAVVEPIPTFGMRQVADFGVYSRGAVGGDLSHHVLIDNRGTIWSIASNLTMQKHGYAEFIGPILNGEVAISMDKEYKELYISGVDEDQEAATYVLGETGLSRSLNAVTSCIYNNGSLLGVAKAPAGGEVIVSTNIIDFGIPDLKTIGMIEVAGAGLGNVYVSVDYRHDATSNFMWSPWIKLNSMGFAYVGKTAKEFHINIASTDPSTFALQQVVVKWKLSGKRTVRGIYAAPNVTRPRSEALG